MYLDFFQLQERPFLTSTPVDRYFPADGIEAARVTLDRCIRRSEGIGLVIGTPGTGKSMLCRSLEKHLGDLFQVVMIRGGRIGSPRALLQSVQFGLERPYRGLDENELRLDLQHLLESNELNGRPLLLIVDDSQGLKMSVLDELRAILNLGENGPHGVQLILAGTSLLEEHLGSPKLQSLNQRIVARCYLEPLERDETFAFVLGQLKIREKAIPQFHIPLFSDEACAAVHSATGGVPRLINQLCDHAMLFAFTSETGQVDRLIVEEAWADLQQLPMPARSSVDSNEQGSSSGEAVVEFGSLDDGPESFEMPAGSFETSSELCDISPEPCEASPELCEEPSEPCELVVFDAEQPIAELEIESELYIEPELEAEMEMETKAEASDISRPDFRFNNPFEEVFEEEVIVSGDQQYFDQMDGPNSISDETPILVNSPDTNIPEEEVCSFGELTDEFEPEPGSEQCDMGSSDECPTVEFSDELPVIEQSDIERSGVKQLSDPLELSGATILDCLAEQSAPIIGQMTPVAGQYEERAMSHAILPTFDGLDPQDQELADDHEIDDAIERQLALQTTDESLQLNVVSVEADDEPQAKKTEQIEQVGQADSTIVVEDGYDEGDILPVSPFFVVRQQQFDSLFSRLRKTS